jgi:deoxyribodipyrimidine photo-lyase
MTNININPKYIGIYIFTRDLSINEDFIKAYNECEYVIPIFVLNPQQISKQNKYRSIKAILFMMNSLFHLKDELLKKCGLNLLLFHDTYKNLFDENLYNKLMKLENKSDNKFNFKLKLYISKDYTSYAKKRESFLDKFCINNNIEFSAHHNVCLLPPGTILTGSNETYKKFTPFYNKFIQNIDKVSELKLKFVLKKFDNEAVKYASKISDFFYNNSVEIKSIDEFYKILQLDKSEIIKYMKNDFIYNPYIMLNNIIKDLNDGKYNDYEKMRDNLMYSTTHLSVFLKFGLISIKEVFHIIKDKYGINHALIRQLIWRDFYYNLGNTYDHVLNHNVGNKSFNLNYDKIKWADNQNELFKAWSNAQTGIPIVDASITELLETGYMHNRMRMLVASVLVKQFLVDWRLGEKFFAQHLLDYDPLINNLNWQFQASSGSFGFDYFRQLKPESQNARFDKNCEYVKKWLPQLNDIPNKHIIQWEKYYDKYQDIYIPPIKKYDKDLFINAYKKYVL